MLTVREVLAMEPLQGLKVMAGEGGLDRAVTTVSVMDALDIYKWMKGGEFLITSGQPLYDDPSYLSVLIQQLKDANAGCLGIKTYRFLESIPQSVLDTANRLSFPLIHIPKEYAFTDIINPVLRELIDKQARMLALSSQIHKCFTELAVTEQSVEVILESLGSLIGRETAFFDYTFSRMFVPERYTAMKAKVMGVRDKQTLWKSLNRSFDTYSVSNLSKNYGLILMDKAGGGAGERENIALEHASTILILDAQKRISNQQIENKFRDGLVHDIIYRNINSELELHNRSQLYGWDFSSGGTAVVVDIDNFKKNYHKHLDNQVNLELDYAMKRIYQSISELLQNRFATVACSRLTDSIVILVANQEPLSEQARLLTESLEEVREAIVQNSRFTATIGIGQSKTDPMQLYQSYEEAKTCVQICRSQQQGNTVMPYDDLGIYKLVNLVLNTKEADELLERYITKLEQSEGELLPTFLEVCESGWNLKAVSKKLYLHYNTVKYRYTRICELLGTDFKNTGDRTQAEIAVKIYQMRKNRPLS